MSARETGERSECGFTLLELLIVITILGLILVALTGGVRFAGQAWEVQQRRSERQGDLDAVEDALRTLIASGYGFSGDGSSLTFTGTLPFALARGGLYDVDFGRSGDRLVLGWRAHFKGPAANLSRTETTLAQGVSGVALVYYDSRDGGWQTMLADKNRPPALIRITLDFADGRTPRPLLVAPMIELQPAVRN